MLWPTDPRTPLAFKRMGDHEYPVPSYQSELASGMDLQVTETRGVKNCAGFKASFGWAVQIPYGFEGHIRPRSSISKRMIITAFGTIDCDYRGELGAMFINLSGDTWFIEAGDRIAQLVITPVVWCRPFESVHLEPTARGDAGWGSSGR